MNQGEAGTRHPWPPRALNLPMAVFARAFALFSGALLVFAVALPASAAPTETAIAKIYQLPCADTVCGSGDTVIASGALVRGAVQIQVSSRAQLGLESIRLEAGRAGSFVCWKTWLLSGAEVATRVFDWDTSVEPATCEGRARLAGGNGVVELRAVAVERTSGDRHTSPRASLRVNNRPTTPQWASEPRAIGPEDGGPNVELRWAQNPEPDVIEYHYVRVAPNGDEVEFAVNAANPGRQACDLDAGIYTCTDDAFGDSGYGGRYSYTLIAYRSSPSTADSCSLPPASGCVQSAAGDEHGASLVEPGVEKPETRVLSTRTGGKSSGGRTGRRPRPVGNGTSYRSLEAGKYYFNDEFSKTLPYGDRTLLAPSDDGQPPIFAAGPVATDTPAPRQVWISIAAGLLTLVFAGHVARVARDPAR